VLIVLLKLPLAPSIPQPTLIRASQAAFGWHIETVDSNGGSYRTSGGESWGMMTCITSSKQVSPEG